MDPAHFEKFALNDGGARFVVPSVMADGHGEAWPSIKRNNGRYFKDSRRVRPEVSLRTLNAAFPLEGSRVVGHLKDRPRRYPPFRGEQEMQ